MAATSPAITLPAADAPFTAVAQLDRIGSVQPNLTCHDRSIDGTICSGLTAKILLGASTPPVTITIIPSVIPPRDRRLLRWTGCWAGYARSVEITHVLTLTAVTQIGDVLVIHV